MPSPDHPADPAATTTLSPGTSKDRSEAVSPEFHGAQNHCFGCGLANPSGLKLQFSVQPNPDGANPTVLCSTQISDHYEGPPGYLHGGIIATLLDEGMSKASRARGVTAMTRNMQVDYLRPVPSNFPIQIEGRVTRSEGRKHFTEARITLSGGNDARVLAQATALFIAVERR